MVSVDRKWFVGCIFVVSKKKKKIVKMMAKIYASAGTFNIFSVKRHCTLGQLN